MWRCRPHPRIFSICLNHGDRMKKGNTDRTVRTAVLRGFSTLLLATAASQPLHGQTSNGDNGPVAVLNALSLSDSAEIDFDGRVAEAFWQQAVPISDFTQQEPVEGGRPSQRTEIRVAFDEDNLYLGAILYDDPDGIIAFQRQRDAFLWTDDRLMWILDTFLDGRTGYYFEINPAGLMGDGLLGGGGGRGGGGGYGGDRAWDGIWEARTAMRPDGWSAEIRIPFRTLNFNPELDTWGINFQRTVRRHNEEILWRGYKRNEGLRRPIYAGRVTGLKNLSQGVGLEATPSAVASWKNIPQNTNPTSFPNDISLDVNYSVTSSMRASVSVNTDFAEVESDQRRVNLTRFPQRFPERRGFFLEGSSAFSFAPRSGPSPFFSRRIGLRSGQQIPIQYGTRLTGQVGKYELGFYQIGTRRHGYFDESSALDAAIPGETFTVARVKRAILEQSSIGAIYTRRASSASDSSTVAPVNGHTAGIDLAFNTRNFLGNHRFEAEAFIVWNSNPDPTIARSFGDLSARGFRLNFPNDIWSGHLSYREFGDAYDPSLGFVTRNGFRRVEPRIGWAPRPESIDWIRRFNFSAQFRNLVQLGTGILEEREWQFDLIDVDFESGDNISLEATRTYEFLDYGFQVSDGVEILPGDYTTWDWQLRGRTTGRRRVSGFASVGFGEFWDGNRTRMSVRASFRPNPGIELSTNFERNMVTLPRGDFDADVYQLEGEWNPSQWISLTNQLQYDNATSSLGLFARLRWIVRPGNDVFLVYTHNWRRFGEDLLDRRAFTTLSRGAAIKANYTYRF